MRERVILHCDMNNFFASVEVIKNPQLRGLPIAVCGDPERRHGIVLAKSEPAKKCGVKTGMPIWQARSLCPDLVIVASEHADYLKYSRLANELYYRYTDKIEGFGIDECWLDVTQSLNLFRKNGEQIADEIREAMKAELGLSISVGVSWNKIFAKLGSDLKKPDATTVISRENFREVVFGLPAADLLFVGRKTEELLAKLNIFTIGDLAAFDEGILGAHIGVAAHKMIEAARGGNTDAVKSFGCGDAIKSVGNGTTLPCDLTAVKEVEQVVYLLCEEVSYRMRRHKVRGKCVSLAVRDEFLEWVSAQQSIKNATNACMTICDTAMKIFAKIWKMSKPVRSLRVSVSNLSQATDAAQVQLDFLGDGIAGRRNDKISEVFDSVRRKHGTQSIMYAGALTNIYELEFEVLDE